MDHYDGFGDMGSRAPAVKGLTPGEVNMNAFGESPAFYPFNQRSV
jgi:hypothetical protein